MSASIYIYFGIPSHGWLNVDFNHQDFQLEFSASDVLSDPLEELYNAIINLNENKAGKVIWWLEPDAYIFDFDKIGSTFVLNISLTDDLHNEEDEIKTISTITGNYKQIIEPFINLLIEFYSQPHDKNDWPYAMDKSKLNTLGTMAGTGFITTHHNN